MKQRIDEIDALRGLAIFLVVLGHSIIYYPINLHEIFFWNCFFNYISLIHLPLFFVISGICFSYKNNYKDYIIKKIKRLVIPYIFFSILDMILRASAGSLVNRNQEILSSVWQILFNGGEYWFLYTLFIIFIIFPFLYNKCKNNKIITYSVLVISFILSFLKLDNELIFNLDGLMHYFIFFYIGFLFKDKIINFLKYKSIKSIILELALMIGYSLVCIFFENIFLTFNTIFSIIGVIIVIIIFKNIKLLLYFKEYGKFSLQIYLLNGFMLVLSRTIICKFTSIGLLIVSFNMLVNFYLSYLVIKYIISKIKFLKIPFGI